MKRNKYLLLFIAALVLTLLFSSALRKSFTSSAYGATGKFTSFLTEEGKKFKNVFSFVFEISSLRKQNEELSQLLSSFQVDKSKINELQHENQLLKKELGFVDNFPDNDLVSARIIGREPTTFYDYIIIDKGEKDGLKKGMPVVASGALVGQISESYQNQAKVTLITSKDSIILAMLQKSRSKGILRGGISGLVLENITQDVEYKEGEFVVTSGLDKDLKSGILIGKTGKVETTSSDLFKNIIVEPIVDLSRLEIVFVLR